MKLVVRAGPRQSRPSLSRALLPCAAVILPRSNFPRPRARPSCAAGPAAFPPTTYTLSPSSPAPCPVLRRKSLHQTNGRIEEAGKPGRPPLLARWHDVFRVASGRTCAVGSRQLRLGRGTVHYARRNLGSSSSYDCDGSSNSGCRRCYGIRAREGSVMIIKHNHTWSGSTVESQPPTEEQLSNRKVCLRE